MRVVITDQRYPDRDGYTQPLEAAGGEVVYAGCETENDVIEATQGADIVVVFKAPVTREVIESLSDCKLIMRNGTGYDNVDIAAASEHGIPVSNVPGYGDEDVSSHAITLMLAAAHEVVYSDQDLRAAEGWGQRRSINPMYDRTFGIIGLGRIGRATIKKARGFGMDVIAYDPYVADDVFGALDVERVSFNQLLTRADAISIHTPLTAETRHMFSTDQFERMNEDAVLVNTARGPIVDEEALVTAVEESQIFAAGLDVFETEPPTQTPAFDADRIVCSPHHGGMSARATERCIQIGVEEIERVISGEHPQNVVNPEVFQRGDGLANPELEAWSDE
jgi:D-3-phosphoglycerate dehydrogenase